MSEAPKIAVTNVLLGIVITISILSIVYLPFKTFALYILAMSIFHFLEYFITAIYKPEDAHFDSFLLNHSRAYLCAFLASILEYICESTILSSMKLPQLVSHLGLVLVIIGQLFRSNAMITAGVNFSHIIQEEKQKDHKLVTSGIYSIVRHPSYSGFFIWSIGTQLLLGNPLCSMTYLIVTWKYFKDRIRYEEVFLAEFFRGEYEKYRENVSSGIPFIK
ncbi:farnesyl cysteine carboxyl-methyltransferase [Rozella allomycis CSF55]|uniref:Protein-S-isoprenylcysteine O-methyltransferase n=1 Tax=Rozella allomycis (strain CSF55) TaxID=988480 RepID=A0A075AU38_ROZAC|nr:Isoprenylcysteine carboxyl methyltransferase domain-containing protein [Rozella allomycis CSF55]RKP19503.1 farnesyl cysteine carboxyl-methyltransferase [Rozella allomycis CSF55]|eukprot:EPZ32232.1 Isoprenylcysteine carboxyl methyltransferase domain-containing protein [Rozella allomycis CSF55]